MLIIDDAQQTLAPLSASLTGDTEDITVHSVQPDAAEQHISDSRYDAVVLQAETYERDDCDLRALINDRNESMETIIIAGSRGQSPSTAVDDAVDKLFEVTPDSPVQYQIVATGIKEHLFADELPPSAGGSVFQIPETVSDSTEAILLIEDNKFIDCTDAAAEFLGYESSASIRGCHPAELSPPTQPDGRSSARKVNDVFEVAQSGGYHRFNWVHKRADGREKSVIVSLMPVMHKNKQVLYCVWREPSTASATDTRSAIEPTLARSVGADTPAPRALVIDRRSEAGLPAVINRSETEMTATPVSTFNEAQLAVESRDDIDCVVLSRYLPDTNAKPFLTHMRDTHPALPVIAVYNTAQDVGIDTETDHRVDVPLFETLDANVGEPGIHREYGESSTGYQAVLETLPIPVAFFHHRQVIYLNGAFQTAIGRDLHSFGEASGIETVVHPNDRHRCIQILEEWHQGNSEQRRHVVRLETADGSTRHFEIAGTPLMLDGRRGVLVSFWDVTDRFQAKQETAFERALYSIAVDQFSTARTQGEFDAGIVEGLTQRGYDLAWIGTVDGTALNTHAVDGDREFYARLESALAGSPGAGEPVVRAAKTGTTQYVADIETLLPAEWRDAALEAGYRSSFAVPLSSHETTYGVLAIYSRERDPFSERDRRLLTQFADAVAFASHSLQLQASLAAGTVTEATITIDDEAYYLVDLAQMGAFDDYPGLRVVGSVRNGETAVLQYLTAHGSASVLRDRLAAHTAVADVSIIDESDPVQIQVTVTDSVPAVRLAQQGVVVNKTAVNTAGAVFSVELPTRVTLQSVVESLETEYEGVTAQLVDTPDREMRSRQNRPFERADLTDKQRTALQAAYYNGYFAQPRRSTATEIAASLGVGHSTFLQHLHRAQEKVFESCFE